MSCRTTYAGSAFTTFARLAAGNEISDVATLSQFHALRRNFQQLSDRPWMLQQVADQVTPEAYQALVADLRTRVANDPSLSDARRASLLARLDSAAGQLPDQATIYALREISESMRTQAQSQAGFLQSYATVMGITLEEARARWNALENGIDRGRSAADPATYTEDNIDAARSRGLGQESGTVHAFVTMRDEAAARESASLATVTRRFIPTPVTGQTANVHGERVVAVGHDPRTGYGEVVVEGRDGVQRTYAYRNFHSSYVRDLTSGNRGSATEYWTRHLRGSTWMQFDDPLDAQRAAAAPRCPMCGQFSDIHHSCPVAASMPVEAFNLWGDYRSQAPTSYQRTIVPVTLPDGTVLEQEIRTSLPQVTPMRTAVRTGSIMINGINESLYLRNSATDRGWYGSNRGTVTGDLAVFRNEDGTLDYRTSELRCTCDEYLANSRCAHIDAYLRSVRARLTPPTRTPAAALTPEQRAERTAEAQRRAEALAATDWTRNEATLAEARKTWRADAEVTYAENFDAFERHYNEALEAQANKNGAPAIPYLRQDALGGMATRGSGQAFGMEIEYEFPSTMSYTEIAEANARIGAALKAANLTDHDTQQQYHTATQAGFRDYHVDPATGKGTWSWERDGSVSGGELVTPAMYDEPETWEKLEQAVKILRDHGAIASTRAGAHVHVGTGMYAGDPKKYGELARLMTQHEDVMFRLAQNPERKSHRQGNYTMPLQETPSGDWRDLAAVKNWQSGRTRVLNFNHVNTDTANSHKDHPEFRIFDSTLDVGAMQSQIKLAVAMTHAAARNADAGGTPLRAKEHLGAHTDRTKGRRRAPTREDLIAETTTFRSFMDTLFAREVDKRQLTALFAATKWNKAEGSNRRQQLGDSIRSQMTARYGERTA